MNPVLIATPNVTRSGKRCKCLLAPLPKFGKEFIATGLGIAKEEEECEKTV